MPKGYFNKLEGHDGYSIMDPLLGPEDIISDPNIVFNANARKLYQSREFDQYKPFYGYILRPGFIIPGKDLVLHNEHLMSYAALEHQKDTMGFYVRIPLIHQPSIMDPDVVKNKKDAEALVKMHTFCTVDPTRINSLIKLESKTIVKIHFTDNNYTKGRIIGAASGVGGGVLGSIVDAILRGPSGGAGGEIDCAGKPAFSPITKRKQSTAIILGASVGPTLQWQLADDGFVIDRAAPDDGIATCELAMQVGGRQNHFFLAQMDKVLANPQELAKYANYKYVFINSPNGNDLAAHSQGGKGNSAMLLRYADEERKAGSALKLLEKATKIFPAAGGVFYIIKGTCRWDGRLNLTPAVVAEFYKKAGYNDHFRVLKAQMLNIHHGIKSVIRNTEYPDGTKGVSLNQSILRIVNGQSDADITE